MTVVAEKSPCKIRHVCYWYLVHVLSHVGAKSLKLFVNYTPGRSLSGEHKPRNGDDFCEEVITFSEFNFGTEIILSMKNVIKTIIITQADRTLSRQSTEKGESVDIASC